MTKNKILKIFAFIIINLTILSCQNSKHQAKEKPATTPPLKSLQHIVMNINESLTNSKQPINRYYDKHSDLYINQIEIELNEKANWLQRQNNQVNNIHVKSKTSNEKKQPKKLRYLFFANGGIVGYYNDSTYTGCPRCDFCKSNIAAMFSAAPTGTYLVQNDGSLLLNDDHIETPSLEDSIVKWALINYKWHIKPPQY